MSETKTCSLTEYEIRALINVHANCIDIDIDEALERMNYLNRRLKAEKKEVEVKTKPTLTETQADAIGAVSKGW